MQELRIGGPFSDVRHSYGTVENVLGKQYLQKSVN